jgi:hypothetical protein
MLANTTVSNYGVMSMVMNSVIGSLRRGSDNHNGYHNGHVGVGFCCKQNATGLMLTLNLVVWKFVLVLTGNV